MDFKLIFEKTMESLGLDPGQYKLSFTGVDQIKDLGAGSSNPWGLACGSKKTIWVKDSLNDLETIRVLLHEAKHLQQMAQGYSLPQDKDFMERDANEYAAANLMDSYLLAKFGKALSGMELIKAGFELIRTL